MFRVLGLLLLAAGCSPARSGPDDGLGDAETDVAADRSSDTVGPDDGDTDDGGVERIDISHEPWDTAADVSSSCEYRELTASCDGWDYATPDLPHTECGPDARELYLPRGVASTEEHDSVSVWGDHAFVLSPTCVTAIDLTTGESRLIECDYPPLRRDGYVIYWDAIGSITVARFGASVVMFRGVYDALLESTGLCPPRRDDILYDWDSGASEVLRSEYDLLPRDEGWPCSAGRGEMGVDAWGDIVVKAEIGPDCSTWITTEDLRTGELIPRVNLFFPPAWVSIWRNKIAFSAGQVEVLDLSTSELRHLAPTTARQTEPDIWEERVVWTDWRGGATNVYWHDLATGATTAVTSGPGSHELPRVFGDHIVYVQAETGGSHVWLYDIPTGERRQITSNPGSQQVEELWDDKLFFQQLDPGATRGTLCEMSLPP